MTEIRIETDEKYLKSEEIQMKDDRKEDLSSGVKEIGAKKAAPPPKSQFPWLVYDHLQRSATQTFYSLKPAEIYHQRISELKQKKVFSCSYGYLVLYDYIKKLISLFNCTTFDSTHLPKLCPNPTNAINSCLLSSSPKSPNCRVLVFLENCQSIMCCRISSNEWIEIRYANQLREVLNRTDQYIVYMEKMIRQWYFCDPVFCRGKLIANLRGKLITNSRVSNRRFTELWSIDIIGKEEQGPVLSRLDSSRFKDEYVVESDGELYCVSVQLSSENRHVKSVEMTKLSSDGWDWERVSTLKNRSFFICQDYSVSCPTPGLDCVFFTMADDLSLYTYNLGDDSLSVSLPFATVSRPIKSRPFWMMPEVLITQEEDCCNQGRYEARLLDSEKEDGEEKPSLMDLPLDFLTEVTKLLNPHVYLSFRSLSRMCRLAAPLSEWRKRRDHGSFPLHMLAERCRGLYRFVHPLQNRAQSYLMTIPDCLKDAKVRYSNHGWLLMSARRPGYVQLHLYNPFTQDILSCDPPKDEAEIMFFTSKPSSSSCSLIEITSHFVGASITSATNLGRWRRHRLYPRGFDAADCASPVLFQNSFYILNKNGDLAIFHFNDMTVGFQSLGRPYTPFITCHQNFLVECGGDLISVFVGHLGKWIYVYKMKDWAWAWETITSLKGYALYLSQASSFSEMASPGLDNRIYFPTFRDGGALYYALDRAEWKFVGSEETLHDFSDTELQLHSCWIKPSWS